MADDTRPGRPYPLGATLEADGANFSVFSRSARTVELLLFDAADDARPIRVIPLDRRRNRSFYYWHVFVPRVRAGQLYGYRVHGPRNGRGGRAFDGEKLLLDPYGKGVAVPSSYDRAAAKAAGDNCGTAMKSALIDCEGYDWEGDQQLDHPFERTVIYELHVGGFTKHPSSGVSPNLRGTYCGLIEKIPHLQDLGITAVELLPAFQFDEQHAPPGLQNYWGYSPVSFFAPHVGYASRPDPQVAVDEFRDMVKALHRADIEVILDVVYNHTAEGPTKGATLSWRGFEEEAYYLLDEAGDFRNFTGCGNTVNGNYSIVRRMILDSLRWWVQEMHVDGFRFDLASILARDQDGQPTANPPILWAIESDPRLAKTKIIAEAWDAAGLYQVGEFVGDRWQEWNGRFRDDVRSFLRAEEGHAKTVSRRMLASPDLYGHRHRGPELSVNFVTCHDGFTLNDLVSYDTKHNDANLEEGRDGSDDNRSWNCGVEGPSDDPEIEALRSRQIRNFLTINLISLGTPMILMGDEMRRTQRGNNNAWCHDGPLSWLDWSLAEQHPDLIRFVRKLIGLRQAYWLPNHGHELSLTEFLEQAELTWQGTRQGKPDWAPDSRSLAFTVETRGGQGGLHFMANAWWKTLEFELPRERAGRRHRWRRLIDTSKKSPDDILDRDEAPVLPETRYVLAPRSVVLLADPIRS